MTKPWIASVPELHARLEPARSGAGDHRVSLTVSFDVSTVEPGGGRPDGPHWHGPLRLAARDGWEHDVALPAVRVPGVVGRSRDAAHEALGEAGLVPDDLPYLLPSEPTTEPTSGLAVDVRVVRQTPTSGAWVSPGSSVELEYDAAGTVPERVEPVDDAWVDPTPPCDLISCEWSPLRVELMFGRG